MDLRLTRGLLVGPGAQVDRLAEERRILGKYFPEFSIEPPGGRSKDLAEAKGTLTTFASNSYALRIVLPAKYPHKMPSVQADNWKPERNAHLVNGKYLCVMRSAQWQSFMSAAFVVAKAAIWLNKYEIWIDKHIWPGAEQHKRGPIYMKKKRRYEL